MNIAILFVDQHKRVVGCTSCGDLDLDPPPEEVETVLRDTNARGWRDVTDDPPEPWVPQEAKSQMPLFGATSFVILAHSGNEQLALV